MSPDRKGELPEEFVWKYCPSIKAQFPMPQSWFFREESAPGTYACFFSREAIGGRPLIIVSGQTSLRTTTSEGYFTTGLSVSTFYDIDRKTALSASTIAESYMRGQKNMIPTSNIVQKKEGPLRIFRRYFKTEQGRMMGRDFPPTVYYMEMTGNDHTGNLYVIIFETPSDKWEEDRQIAQTMIEQRILDPSV